MKDQTKKEFRIGLCVIGALVILYFGIEFLKGHSPLKKHTEYHVVYDDVLGLAATANVNLSGMKIGQVSSVELIPDRPGKVLVTFRLDKEVDLPVNTSVAIVKDLLGTSSMSINLAQGDVYYHPGDTLPGTLSGGLMGEVSEMLPEVTSIIPKVDTLLANINDIVGHPSLKTAIENLTEVTDGLTAVVGTINKATRPLPSIISAADSAMQSISVIANDITALSHTLANAPVDSIMGNVDRIAKNVSDLTDALSNPESSLGQLLKNTTLYDNLITVTSDIDSLLVDIKRNPKRYISIKLL